MVVSGLSKSSFKLLLLAPNLLSASRWRSFGVVGGRQSYFVLFPYCKNENDRVVGSLSWSLMVAEIDLESIPATRSLTVFEGRYWSLQKLHSCFHIVVDSFWRNFKFSNDRKRPLTTIWKPGLSQRPGHWLSLRVITGLCKNFIRVSI